jgi:exodeoxyribonuclease V alpha subunit
MDLPIVVEKIVFRNEKGFAILACSLNPYSSKYKPELEGVLLKHIKPNSYNNFTVSIDMIGSHDKMEGVQYICLGDFIRHNKYGDQFKAEFMYPDEPTNDEGLKSFLMMMPNIKEARSADIVKTFGFQEAIRILNEDIMRLTEINGITEGRIPPIKEAWDRSKGERELCMWLNNHKIQPSIGKKVYSMWHQDSVKILSQNPYRLTEIKGFGFMRADDIAHKILVSVPKEARTLACMRYVLEENFRKESNLCMPYSNLRDGKDGVVQVLKKASEQNSPTENFNETEHRKLVAECLKKNLDVFVTIKNIHEAENGTFVYLKGVWEREKYIASQIFNRRTVDKNGESKEAAVNRDAEREEIVCDEVDLADAEKDIEDFSHRKIVLDDCQKAAIQSAFNNKMTIITGGGGSGKSTICRCIFHLAQEKHLSVRMMSPTGKAAQVLSDKTGFTAQTIHMSLKMKPGDDYPKEEIREDIVIIDEVSMVGIDTMFAIMHAMKQNLWGHIVFVGDCNQLPSVSPGNFLFDMIKSNCINVVRLDKIYRQDENSFIPLLANDVAAGRVVDIPPQATDIRWNNLPDDNTWEIELQKVVREYIKDNNIDDLQVLAPMYRGVFGINKANEIIQRLMVEINDTGDRSFIRGFATFYIGDRVIQTENNYEKSIFNGDIGKVVDMGRKTTNPNSDEKKDFVTVNFYGEDKMFIDEEIEQLRLAWCVSVHKFQGSQSPHIIAILSSEAQNMMTKELLYCSMTRAEKHLDIYGHIGVFRLAPTRSAIRHRNTNMNNIISELKNNMTILKVLK